MKFRPLHDRVVIERNDAGSNTFPTPSRISRSRARSSPLDPAARDETGKLIPIDVRVGDRILFGKSGRAPRSRSIASSTLS